jgi:hypothetical protein
MTLHDSPDFGLFLEGALPVEREANLLRQIAEDSEARAMLRQEMLLRRHLGPTSLPESAHVPDGFADRVMGRIRSQAGTRLRAADRSPLRSIRSSALVRNTVRVTALAAAVLAGILLGITFGQAALSPDEYVSPVRLAAAEEDQVWVRFFHTDPDAASVALIGDFSDWEPVQLARHALGGTTVWTEVVRVPRGEHRYMFLVDGEVLVTDPLAPLQRDDGFGNRNAVLAL